MGYTMVAAEAASSEALSSKTKNVFASGPAASATYG